MFSSGSFNVNATVSTNYIYTWLILNASNTYVNILSLTNPYFGVAYGGLTGNTLSGSFSGFTSNQQFEYEVVVTDQSTGCSATSNPSIVSIVLPEGNCDPCGLMGNDFVLLGLGGTISSSYTSSTVAKYYMDHTATVSGNVLLHNASVMIDNVGSSLTTLNIGINSVLGLDHCHLYTCTAMWQGMVINSDPVDYPGQLNITDNTLIEDAKTAVSIPAIQDGNIQSGGILNVNNAIFNRNDVGIDIETYNYQNVSNYIYPFSITNTVFTSRNFGLGNYSATWPVNNNGSTGLKDIYSPLNVLISHYKINDNTYAYAYDKNGGTVQYGIKLYNVGYWPSNLSGAPYEIMIGDANASAGNMNQNLFDYMPYGIYANNANASLYNNVFENASYDGVYAKASLPNSMAYRLQVIPSYGTVNEFWNCWKNGVEASNYQFVKGWNSKIISDRNSMIIPALPIPYGYNVQNIAYHSIDLRFNNITNIVNPIFVSINSNMSGGTVAYADIYACQNNITDDPGGPSLNHYVNIGINIQYVLGKKSVPYNGHMHTDSNNITGYNGILVNNFSGQKANSDYNIINLRPQNKVQYGIQHTYCQMNEIAENNISGSSTLYDPSRAVYMSFCSSPAVICNTELNLGRGYEFWGNQAQPNTTWENNTMQNNLRGYVLNYCIIGAQANNTVPGNKWLGGWGTGHDGSFVFDNTSGTYSSAHSPIRYNYSFPVPPNNFGAPSIYEYGMTGSLIPATSPITPTCTKLLKEYSDLVMAQEDVAADSFGLMAGGEAKAIWMSEYAAWQMLQADTVMVDSSTMLLDFDSLGVHSRFAYLSKIEGLLGQGHYGQAQCLMNNTSMQTASGSAYGTTGAIVYDSSAADSIVYTYLKYYELYKKYMQGTLNSSDSSGIVYIAGLCPNLYGADVYAARALYTVVYNDPEVWDDDSLCGYTYNGDNGGKGGRKTQHNSVLAIDSTQAYSLYPNPNNGNMVLVQQLIDEQPVNIKVLNAEGQTVYSSEQLFMQRKSPMNLHSLSPGLYMIVLSDMQGKSYTLKFIVN